MLTLSDLHCPICKGAAIKKGKGGLALCSLHGWIIPVKIITLNAAKQHRAGRAER